MTRVVDDVKFDDVTVTCGVVDLNLTESPPSDQTRSFLFISVFDLISQTLFNLLELRVCVGMTLSHHHTTSCLNKSPDH